MKSDQKISVLHLISSADFLGAERVVCELASSANPSRFQVQVGLLGAPQKVVDTFKSALEGTDAALVYFPCPRKISLSCIRSIQQFLQMSKTDLIHCHGYKSDLYAYCAAKLPRSCTQLIATNHTWKLRTLSERIYRLVDKTLLQSFDAVVAVSGEVYDEMINLGVAGNRLSIIHNGVSVDGYDTQCRAAVRRDLGIAEHELIVGCVASLTKEKAHVDLIRAFALLGGKVPHARLVLIGDGPERTNLVSLSESLGVSDKIVFAGQRRDVKLIYMAFDMFALVSHAEGLPMAMLEAMAASMPVVVSAVGAIPMVINQMQSGMLVRPGDIQGIADALSMLAQEPELRDSLGRNARKEVLANYSVTRMTRDYEQLYDKVLGSAL